MEFVGGDPGPLLQWGHRKRLRCTKFQRGRDEEAPPAKASSPADRHVARLVSPNRHRTLRISEAIGAMKSNGVNDHQHNGAVGTSPEGANRAATGAVIGKEGQIQVHHQQKNGVKDRSPASSGSGDAMVWPKFEFALTNKEKEEDFLLFKGSKLPVRPKKRTKIIQRTLNLVSPGAWLCDLTLERYEVREKKIFKKRPRGLRAMGNVESESE